MKKKNFHMTYGFVTAIFLIIVSVVLYIAGLGYESWSQYVSFAVYLAGVLICCRAFAKVHDHYVTFGQVFSAGFKASAIVTLVMVAWTLLLPYIFPEILTKGMEIASQRMSEQGIAEDKIDEYLEMSNKPVFRVMMVFGTLFWFLFLGAIFSLIGAAVNKKKGAKPPFEPAQ